MIKSERKKIRVAHKCVTMKKQTKKALASTLGLARSTLYYHKLRPVRDAPVLSAITAVMAEHPAYGHRRIALHLNRNHKVIARLMRTYGLRPAIRRRRRHCKPDDIGKPPTVIPNIMKKLCPVRPTVVWAGDFTYLWFIDRFWYVATVIDVYTREVVGWHIANQHTTTLIVEAFLDAVRRTKKTPLCFHSDQGSEYVSGTYELLLRQHGVLPSHSKKASPWQNGYQESFYSNFKLELGSVSRFTEVGELIEAVHRQINYYNKQRIHSAIKMPPYEFRIKQTNKTNRWTADAVHAPAEITNL